MRITVFVMLFGLYMDYEVFLVRRMQVTWIATRVNDTAIATGIEQHRQAHRGLGRDPGRGLTAEARAMTGVVRRRWPRRWSPPVSGGAVSVVPG